MVRRTIGAIAFAVVTTAYGKQVEGTGEFRFGPETAQNVACDIAEQKAKENAIANFVGEYIEHQTNQICKDEQCIEFRTLFSETSGKVKNVIDKNVLVAPERGYSVCIVDLKAEVQKITNTIRFTVEGSSQFKHGEYFSLNAISNRLGHFAIFNLVDDRYTLVYQNKISKLETEYSIPGIGQFKAEVIPGKYQSNELLVSLFSLKKLTYKDSYSRMEFNEMVNDLPFLERKVILYPINIVR